MVTFWRRPRSTSRAGRKVSRASPGCPRRATSRSRRRSAWSSAACTTRESCCCTRPSGNGPNSASVLAAAQADRGHGRDQGNLGRLQFLRGGRHLPCGCGSRGPARLGPSTPPPTADGGGCCVTSPSPPIPRRWSGSASWLSPRPAKGARPRLTTSPSGPARRRICATAADLGEAARGDQSGQVGGEPELGRVEVRMAEAITPVVPAVLMLAAASASAWSVVAKLCPPPPWQWMSSRPGRITVPGARDATGASAAATSGTTCSLDGHDAVGQARRWDRALDFISQGCWSNCGSRTGVSSMASPRRGRSPQGLSTSYWEQ